MLITQQIAAQTPDLEAHLRSLGLARDAQVVAEDFSGALVSAEALVDALEDTGDRRLAGHIVELAAVQTQLGELESAEANYLRGLQLLEQRDGELALSLVAPYHGLARSYIDGARYEEAITVLGHAQDLNQRNLGLFNLEQTTLLDDMAVAFLSVGDTTEAHRIQRERLNIAVRRFGAESPEVIPFRLHLGQYYEFSRMRGRAREQYQQVLEAQEANSDPYDASLLLPLRKLILMDLARNDPSPARRNLIEILDSNEDVPPLERAMSLTTLGDWEMGHKRTEVALDYYRDAWRVMQADPRPNPDELYGKPAPISFITPLGPVDMRRRPSSYAWGGITLSFVVSANGRASDIQIVSAEPASLMDARYIGRIRETYFRPRFVSAEPTLTNTVKLSH
ncbi:MAG: tetratricopeptide repeat protein, partial [Gammaproteobacteria bacterium]